MDVNEERRIEVFVKIQKKKFFLGGGGGGVGSVGGGGQGGCEQKIGVFRGGGGPRDWGGVGGSRWM